ncbi:TPA: hypothetical protein QBX83_002632 [Staphylococcus aureus]|uniref:hypothetical protein n=1 Tax=Staphylococcus TaxID=1279 RepID=UPI00044AAF5B|nr:MULTISPECIES: hypothetical protein [Staphylococcus]EZY85432.1 hypothetical protein V123_02587 [Staphylococcus aureus Rd.545]EZY91308.1 hypothetical protein V124_02589 [Staphylococcus aureus Rd.614]KAH19265.1 hypothetical protein W691_02499 [Staphylococcus aureus VET1831R]KAI12265.1 hypothetical protein W732_02405 [Staphylococcus aureus VET1893R]MBU8863528.1 hypothetical protein [Staphylococcus aureus]
MYSMKTLIKGYKREIDALQNAQSYTLNSKNIDKHVKPSVRGIYAFYHNGTLIYIGQGGGNIDQNTTSQTLKTRLKQYTGENDSGTKNVKNYLKENGVSHSSDLEFSFISIADCRLIKIIELVMIDYFKPQVNK